MLNAFIILLVILSMGNMGCEGKGNKTNKTHEVDQLDSSANFRDTGRYEKVINLKTASLEVISIENKMDIKADKDVYWNKCKD